MRYSPLRSCAKFLSLSPGVTVFTPSSNPLTLINRKNRGFKNQDLVFISGNLLYPLGRAVVISEGTQRKVISSLEAGTGKEESVYKLDMVTITAFWNNAKNFDKPLDSLAFWLVITSRVLSPI